jgi:hypothetical protein
MLNRAVWDTFAAMGVVRRFAVAGLDEAARKTGRRRGLAVGAVDETGQVKSGTRTAGVKRQYLGCAGKAATMMGTGFRLRSNRNAARAPLTVILAGETMPSTEDGPATVFSCCGARCRVRQVTTGLAVAGHDRLLPRPDILLVPLCPKASKMEWSILA